MSSSSGALRQAKIQRAIGHWFFFVPLCGSLILFLKWGLRYRVHERKRLRAEFRALTRDERPLLICANHLTYMDPIILIYAFGNHWWYLFHYRYLSWNLPAVEYRANPFFRLVCFASKCLFIDRKGTREHHREVLNVARQLLSSGEVLTIFPEGRRSRSGRFDDSKLAYGIGRIVSQLPECRVLCVYSRASSKASGQASDALSADQDQLVARASFPPRHATFTLLHEVVEIRNSPAQSASRERSAEITREIASRIQILEQRYFTSRESSRPHLTQTESPEAASRHGVILA